MAKAKTSRKQRRSSANVSKLKNKRIFKLKKNVHVKEIHPMQELLDEELIMRAIWECLKDGDAEGVIEVLETYLYAVNKTRVAKQASLARSTIYSLKGGNPTVKTLAKLVHACA